MKETNPINEFYLMNHTFLRRGFGLRKIEEKAGGEKKYEKRRKPLPGATPKTRVIRGSTFSIFNLHA